MPGLFDFSFDMLKTGLSFEERVKRMGRRESDKKLFKCFNPPEGGSFEAAKEYEWEWCIDGIVVYDGSGAPTAFGEYEVFQFFSLIS